MLLKPEKTTVVVTEDASCAMIEVNIPPVMINIVKSLS